MGTMYNIKGVSVQLVLCQWKINHKSSLTVYFFFNFSFWLFFVTWFQNSIQLKLCLHFHLSRSVPQTNPLQEQPRRAITTTMVGRGNKQNPIHPSDVSWLVFLLVFLAIKHITSSIFWQVRRLSRKRSINFFISVHTNKKVLILCSFWVYTMK